MPSAGRRSRPAARRRSRRPRDGRCRGRTRRDRGSPARRRPPARSPTTPRRSRRSPSRRPTSSPRPRSGPAAPGPGRRACRRSPPPLERPGDPVDEPRDPRVDPAPAMRSGVDVHDPGAEAHGRLSSDASSSIERSRRTSSAPARLIRYEAWTTSGAMSRPSRALAERRDLGRGLGPPLPGRRVVAEDLEGGGPDLGRAIRGLHHPVGDREMSAEPPAVGKHRRHPSGRASARVA